MDLDFIGNVLLLSGINIGVSILGLSFSVVFSILFARTISKPLVHFSKEIKNISKLEVNRGVKLESIILEVRDLVEAFEVMKTTLRSFMKFLPRKLIADLVAKGVELKLGGTMQPAITIFFADIEDFTSWSEIMDPSFLIYQLSEYFHVISEEITKEKGTLDKYIGDAVMSFWGAPTSMNDSAVRGCRAAIRCQERLEELRKKWAQEKKPEMKCRIGIHFGPCIIGNIGSKYRLNYTAIGDNVNLSSRLEGLNKVYGTVILISSEVLFQPEVVSSFHVRQIDRVGVKGKLKATVIYELICMKDSTLSEMHAKKISITELYQQGLFAYYEKEFELASRMMKSCLDIHPVDVASKVMYERCCTFQQYPPPDDWDGVHRFYTK